MSEYLRSSVIGYAILGPQELDIRPSPYVTPGSIGPAKCSAGGEEGGKEVGKGLPNSKDVWTAEQVSTQQQYEYDDPRPKPE